MWPRAALSLVLVGLMGASGRAEQPALFPFVISYDAPQNVTNVSSWVRRPAGADGFVRAEGAHLVTDAGPVRFFGTNLCFEACFPVDSRSIWGKSPNKLTIDPEQLARLDYLIYQLKQHGIYVNLNLHVSRTLGPAEGFPHLEGRPKYDKGLDNFEPRMIEAQQRYARDLLTHVNPHTGKPYTDEPAVAFVEISNEDALFTVWGRGQLESLPEPYATTFRRLWNAWLRDKYGTTEKLQRAWHGGSRPLGREMLRNGDFSQPLERTPGPALLATPTGSSGLEIAQRSSLHTAILRPQRCPAPNRRQLHDGPPALAAIGTLGVCVLGHPVAAVSLHLSGAAKRRECPNHLHRPEAGPLRTGPGFAAPGRHRGRPDAPKRPSATSSIFSGTPSATIGGACIGS